jgi:hypothetical protein
MGKPSGLASCCEFGSGRIIVGLGTCYLNSVTIYIQIRERANERRRSCKPPVVFPSVYYSAEAALAAKEKSFEWRLSSNISITLIGRLDSGVC